VKRYVVGLMIADGRFVLLVEKKRDRCGVGQVGKLNGPGGEVRPGETPVDAVVREFREETGIGSFREEWSERVRLIGPKSTCHVFLCRVGSCFPPANVGDEPAAWHAIAGLSLSRLLLPDLQWLVPLCLDARVRGTVRVEVEGRKIEVDPAAPVG
jgi:8-oxo-dGTP pyrophosphatase MutT (NUDIX family)